MTSSFALVLKFYKFISGDNITVRFFDDKLLIRIWTLGPVVDRIFLIREGKVYFTTPDRLAENLPSGAVQA